VIVLAREAWLRLAGWPAAELRIVAERDGASGAARWLRRAGLGHGRDAHRDLSVRTVRPSARPGLGSVLVSGR